MSNLHICAPKADRAIAIKKDCPACKRPSLLIGASYEWYGPDVTCIRCGRNWKSGEWMTLDFHRNARRDNIRAAKRAYRRAKEQP